MRFGGGLRVLILVAGATALSGSAPRSSAQSADSGTVKYQATIDNVKYVYVTAPPVAHIRPGNTLEANSLDCFGNAIKKPGDTLSMIKGDNPLTGPFFIDGAEPGDTLIVRIL